MTFALFAALWIGAVALGRRTGRLAERKTLAAGHPVFYGFEAGRARGGEIHVTGDALVLFKPRSLEPQRRIAWNAVQEVSVRRKGPLGPAGLARLDLVGSEPLSLEVDDGQRFRRAIEERGVTVHCSGWPDEAR